MALHIKLGDNSTHGPKITNALRLLEQGKDNLNDVLGTLSLMIDNDGQADSDYDYMQQRLGTDSNVKAKEGYLELQSLAFKLNTNSSVSDVHAAMEQAFNKFR